MLKLSTRLSELVSNYGEACIKLGQTGSAKDSTEVYFTRLHLENHLSNLEFVFLDKK